MELTPEEFEAVKIIVAAAAKMVREDVIGVILYTGAFHALPDHDEAVVTLAKKLER